MVDQKGEDLYARTAPCESHTTLETEMSKTDDRLVAHLKKVMKAEADAKARLARLQGLASYVGYKVGRITGSVGDAAKEVTYVLYKDAPDKGTPGREPQIYVKGPDGKTAYLTLDQLEAVLEDLK